MWQKLQENPLDQLDIIQSLDEEGNDEVSSDSNELKTLWYNSLKMVQKLLPQ